VAGKRIGIKGADDRILYRQRHALRSCFIIGCAAASRRSPPFGIIASLIEHCASLAPHLDLPYLEHSALERGQRGGTVEPLIKELEIRAAR
jgi:hypothetical protein